MDKKLMEITDKIIGESFFSNQTKDAILLEHDFVRMDKSIIWKCSDLFWKHYSLWEKVYGEDFESSLPSGISESHRTEFINNSAHRFLHLLQKLENENKLPQRIYIYEQGPGTGIFAKGFLDYLQTNDSEMYRRTIYILSDTSQEVLSTCKKALKEHLRQTRYFDQEYFENTNKFKGKVLFARHSNVWDGWPCRHILVRKSGLGEVYVRAISNKKFTYLIEQIQREGLETALLKNREQWKAFFRSIKLQKRTIPIDRIDIQDHLYLQHLSETESDHIGSNTLLSDLIVQNLFFLNKLIGWEKGGYAEIVDIVTSQPRTIYPKKFDGSIGYIVDGHIITTWAESNNRHVTFTPIRKLNTMITIMQKNIQNIMRDTMQNITYEIFPTDKSVEENASFPKDTHIAVTCTSKKGIDYTIDMTILLRKMGLNAYPHIVARIIRDEKYLRKVAKKLSQHKINEIFVAAGDIENAVGKFTSSVELLKGFRNSNFSCKKIAVTGYPEGHHKIPEAKLLEALKEKQEFARENDIHARIITQMCFDADTIIRWVLKLQKKGITLPVIVGIPGPCNLLQLMQFAKKCGVGQSFKFLTSKKTLGKNLLMNMTTQYMPDKLIEDITNHPQFPQTNIKGFHIYTFNNIEGVLKWKEKFTKRVEKTETLIAERNN